jgi:hypothetical protein
MRSWLIGLAGLALVHPFVSQAKVPAGAVLLAQTDIDEDAPIDEFAQDYVQANEEQSGPPAAFQDALSPYGRWLYMQNIGWVWTPDQSVVGTDFQPYASGGQWVSTTDGWVFANQWPFGWATFHYGRWLLDANFGWLWIPGYDWGPSWVDWRYGGGYVGWAPLPPVGFSISVGFSPWWCFVPVGSFTATNVVVHSVPRTTGERVFVATRPVARPTTVGGVRWNQGPPVRAVAPHVGPIETHPSMRPNVVARPSQPLTPPNMRAMPNVAPLPRTPNAARPPVQNELPSSRLNPANPVIPPQTPRATLPPVSSTPPGAAPARPPPSVTNPPNFHMAPPSSPPPVHSAPPAAPPPPVHSAPPPTLHGPAMPPVRVPVAPVTPHR